MITRDFVLIGRLLNSLRPVGLAVALCFATVPRADAQAALSITKTHSGSFTQGQPDATYTVTVSNHNLGGPTTSAVTVTENPPSGLTLVSMSGTGWLCGGNTCTRNDVLPVGASYPVITVTVSVPLAATSPQVNMASVSGGGPGTASAIDSTIVLPPSGVSLVSVPNPSIFGQAATLTASVTPSTATGRVTFYAGTTVLGVSSLSAGVAALSTIMLPAGSAKLQAYYGGDSSHGAGASNVVAQSTVSQPGGAFALSGLPNVGADPVSVAVGDFNGDGKADLAVANAGGPLSILLGNGDGTFRAGGSFAAGANTYSVAVGDFNGDGKPDLAVADFTGGVGVLLGNGDGTFQAVVNNVAGANPQSVVVGDFNGDGKADLAVTNFYGANLNILLGNGDGTFQAAVSYTTGAGTEPYAIAVADFNGDGKADLAVSTLTAANPGGVSILVGNGDGTFQPAVTYPAGTQPDSIAVGDFNGDGRTDVAVTDPGSNNVIVLLGNGDGTLRAAASYPAGSLPDALAVGDFNGDGIPDLAAGNDSAGNVSVLLGNGNGTFQTARSFPLAGGVLGLAVADFNGDGKADIAAATGSNGQVAILFGAPPVTAFSVAPNNGAGFSQNFALNYFDAAGAADLSTVSVSFGAAPPAGNPVNSCQMYYVPAASQLYLYNDSGSPSLTLANSQCSVSLQSAAVNTAGTGLTLNLTVNFTALFAGAKNIYMAAAGSVSSSVFQALGSWTVPAAQASLTISKTHSGSFTQGQTGAAYTVTVSNGALSNATVGTVTVTESTPAGLTLLSMTGTGWACTANTCSRGDALVPGSSYPSIAVTVNVAVNATSPQVNSVSLSGGGSAPAIATDPTVIAPLSRVSLVSAPSPSIFGQAVVLTATVTPSSATGLVTFYDGVVVLGTSSLTSGTAFLSTILLPAASGKLTAYYGGDASHGAGVSNVAAQSVNALAGGGFLSGSKPNAGPDPVSVASGDFNGDGIADLAVANNGGDVAILLGNGDGTFRVTDTKPAGSNPQSVVVGDFNGDGKPDLAVANQGGKVSILLGNGDGTLQPAVNYAAGTIPFSLVVGDFNGDGKADLAVANLLPGSVSILLGNGDGTFAAAKTITLSSGSLPYAVAAGDFNNDGKADLVVSGVSGSVILLLGNGDGTFQPEFDFGAQTAASSIVVADFNNDGNADIAITNGAPANNVSIMLGNGNGTFQTAVTYPAGTQPQSLAVGDFNGDGILDLAIGNARTPYNAGILLGNGDGTFHTTQNYPITGGALAVAVADFNRDGIADLAVAGSTSQVVDILLGSPVVPPVLSVSASHTGDFTQGQSGAVETITVSNQTGAGATVGRVTVTETLPAGLSLASMSGTGWTCAGNACMRSDALAAGSSYPSVTALLNVAMTAAAQVSNQVTVSGGGGATAGATDVTAIDSVAQALSVTPASGSGGSQVFSFQFSDSAGASGLATVSALINGSTALSTACSVTYNRVANTLALLTDAGAQPSGTIAPGSGSQQNSQCTLTGSASSVTVSGNVLTLNLAIGFQSGFDGAKNVYGSAQGVAGVGTGLRQLGTWTVAVIGQPPQAASVSPSSGSGAGQTFTFVYTDVNGALDLASAQAMINASNTNLSSCYAWVTPGTGTIWLAADAGNWSAAMTLGTAGTLQNSQCAVNVGLSSGALTGNTYTLNLAISFQTGFTGAKNIYSMATDLAGLSSGWQTLGTWTTGTVSGVPVVHAVSVSPSSGSGASQAFTFVYTDSNGASDLASAQAIINASSTGVSSCYVWVTPGTGAIWLASDTETWPAGMTLGTAGTLQNSQCAVNVGSSTGSLSGNTYTLTLAVSFQSGFSGAKNIYGLATSVAGPTSGWQTLGAWTAGSGVQAPHAVSVSPSSGSGPSQAFTFVYTDSSGASDLASAQAIVNASNSGVSSCYVWVTPGTGSIWLASDTETWPAGMTLGTTGTLQNSQCSVNVGSSIGALSGNTYTLTLAIAFQSGFSGAKNTYGLATDLAGLSSGWQPLGTWTAAGSGVAALHAVSVSPSSGSGASQAFTFVYTDSNGASDLASAQAIINASNSSVSSCYVWVTPATGAIWLAADAGNWSAQQTLGTAGTLQNSQCAVNVGSSSGTLSGNTYTLTLAIGFQTGSSGAKNIYSMATSLAGPASGWQTVGTWTAGIGVPTLHAVSVSPSSGSAASQTFTFVYTDSNGASDLASAQALVSTSITGVSSCYVWVTPASGAVWLANDNGTWPAGMTLGTAGTMQNSQCAVNAGSSSATLSGNTYTLNLAITFQSGFAGLKDVYGLATSASAVSSGWQTLGSWTP